MYLETTQQKRDLLQTSVSSYCDEIESLCNTNVTAIDIKNLELTLSTMSSLDTGLTDLAESSVLELKTYERIFGDIESERKRKEEKILGDFQRKVTLEAERHRQMLERIKGICITNQNKYTGLGTTLSGSYPSDFDSFLGQQKNDAPQTFDPGFEHWLNRFNAVAVDCGPEAKTRNLVLSLFAGVIFGIIVQVLFPSGGLRATIIGALAAGVVLFVFQRGMRRTIESMNHLADVLSKSCNFVRTEYQKAIAHLSSGKQKDLEVLRAKSDEDHAKEEERFRVVKRMLVNDVQQFDERLESATRKFNELVDGWVGSNGTSFTPLGAGSDLKSGDQAKVLLRIGSIGPSFINGNAVATPTSFPAEARPGVDEPEKPLGIVTSPMVGTVYLSAEPDSARFVAIGTTVTKDQTLLIIEAMKTMNNIPAPLAGTVKRILVSDGQSVEYGAPLLIIE